MSKPEKKPSPGFGAPDSTATTLVIAALLALGIGAFVNWSSGRRPWQATTETTKSVATVTPSAPTAASTASTPQPTPVTTSAVSLPATATKAAPAANAPASGSRWAASATGRIEPRDGELRLVAPVPGRIVEVLVKANDQVFKGDLLVRLDDEDALLKAQAATAEVDVRRRERDEEPATGLALERRKAEDAAADADRDLVSARAAFDNASRGLKAGKVTADELARATKKLTAATDRATQEKGKLAQVLTKGGMPLPTRLESSLASARAELALAEAAVEKMRLRAPADGVALAVSAKVGEYATPSPEMPPLVTFGDIESLRVRAEVEERDATKVRVGQPIVVRADAFPDTEFTGVVTSVSKALAAPRMTARGPRRPNDVEVLEVMAKLDGTPPLLTGMRVDVYFKLDDSTAAAPDKK